MCEIHFGKLTVAFTYCTETFYLHSTDYIYYINILYQSDIGKTALGQFAVRQFAVGTVRRKNVT